MNVAPWGWLGAIGLIGGLVAGDIALHGRKELGGLRPALLESAGWVLLSTGFGGLLGVTMGWALAGQYFSGYLLEKSLSIDNVFAFALLLRSFAVPASDQRRVLYWGVVGALVLRAGFIGAGAAFVDNVNWAFYPFGVVVVAAGVRMARKGAELDVENGRLIGAVKRLVPVVAVAPPGRFLTRQSGRRAATRLLLALVAIEVTDLAFAADSIPAVFGVTTDVFVVFTSNAFAVLGLRSLYFVLAGAMDRFAQLSRGLAVLLVLVGAKMLLKPVVEVPTWLTLAVIVVVVAASIWTSARAGRPATRVPAHEASR